MMKKRKKISSVFQNKKFRQGPTKKDSYRELKSG